MMERNIKRLSTVTKEINLWFLYNSISSKSLLVRPRSSWCVTDLSVEKQLRQTVRSHSVSPQKSARPGGMPRAAPGDLAEAAAEKVGAVQGVGSLPLYPWGAVWSHRE